MSVLLRVDQLLAPTLGGIFGGQSGATGRSDSQIEVQNDVAGTYHALISIFNQKNPGDNLQEGALSYQARDSTGVVRQVASISAMWSNNATVATGYGVLRFNIDSVGGVSELFMRAFGATQGVTFYGISDTDFAGGPFVKIVRTAGKPCLVGTADLVLDANFGGAANTVFLNAYNAGDVNVGNGGGYLLLAKAGVVAGGGAAATLGTIGGGGPAAAAMRRWIPFKESDGVVSFLAAWR